MHRLLTPLPLLATMACGLAGPGPFPGTPVAHTEVASGAISVDEVEGSCTTPTVERFPSLNDAAPYLAEQLPGIASDLPHTAESEQLVVAYLAYCSSGGPRIYVDDIREDSGTVTAYLAVVRPDTAIDISRRPYVIFTIPASVETLETVVDQRPK